LTVVISAEQLHRARNLLRDGSEELPLLSADFIAATILITTHANAASVFRSNAWHPHFR